MLAYLSPGLLESLGINLVTQHVSLTIVRTGDTFATTFVPAVSPKLADKITRYLAEEGDVFAEGVTYFGTGDARDPASFVLTANGEPVLNDGDTAQVWAVVRELLGLSVMALNGAIQFLETQDELPGAIVRQSAALFGEFARRGRADLLALGARRVVCTSACCRVDRNDQVAPDGAFVVTLPEESCVRPEFHLIAEIIEDIGTNVLANVEPGQLRRLKIELADAGALLAVTLPEGDQGEPSEEKVLYSDAPISVPRRPPASSIEGLLEMLGGAGGGVRFVRIDSPEDLDRLFEGPVAE